MFYLNSVTLFCVRSRTRSI